MPDRLPRLALRSQLRLQQLNMVLRLVETGSVRGAAEALSLTQSAVTKSLKELETLFGVPLFERDSHGLHPTPYCAPLEAFARETLLGLDEAVTAIRHLLRGEAGRVCIGVAPGRAEATLAQSLPAIRAAFPRLVLSLHTDQDGELTRLLEAGALDFALLSPSPLLPHGRFSFLPLAEEALLTLVRPSHPFAQLLLVPTARLLDSEWALPPRYDVLRELVGFALLASGADEPPRLMEVNSAAVSLDLAMQLDLVTVVPAALAREALAQGRLMAVNTPYQLPPLRMGILRFRRRELRGGSHAVLSLLLRLLRRERAEASRPRHTA